MKSVTVEQILEWCPCWLDEPDGEERVRAALAPLGGCITAQGVLGLDLTPEDALWVVLRRELLSDRILRLFAVWVARDSLEADKKVGREPDPRSLAGLEVAERYARGAATVAELKEACSQSVMVEQGRPLSMSQVAYTASWAASSREADEVAKSTAVSGIRVRVAEFGNSDRPKMTFDERETVENEIWSRERARQVAALLDLMGREGAEDA